MGRFTTANAREMAARSVARRKSAQAERTPSPATIPLSPAGSADTDLGINVASVRARLETLDGMMSRAKTDREWDNLTRAYDRMFRVWCVLTKTPGPGNRKPAPERPDRRGVIQLQPMLSDAQPVASQAVQVPARPAGWEYDDPASVSAAPIPG